MALNGGVEDLRIDLRGLDVLVSEHPRHVLDGHVMRQCHRGEGVAGDMEREVLTYLQLQLYHVEIVVRLLVGDLRQAVVVLFQHRHRRGEDGREELRVGLDTAAVYIIEVAFLLRHLLEVECLCVGIRQTGVGGEDEQVAHLVELRRKLVRAHLLEFSLGEGLALLALATLDVHQVVGVLLNLARLGELARPLAHVLVVAVAGDVGPRAVVQPRVESHDVLRGQVAVGHQPSEPLHRIDHHNLVFAGADAKVLIVQGKLHVLDEALLAGVRLLLLFRLLVLAVEVVHEVVVGAFFIENVHCGNDFLALFDECLRLGRGGSGFPFIGSVLANHDILSCGTSQIDLYLQESITLFCRKFSAVEYDLHQFLFHLKSWFCTVDATRNKRGETDRLTNFLPIFLLPQSFSGIKV